VSDSIPRPSPADGANGPPRRATLVTALGLIQILSWGSSYYLPAVLAKPIVADTGWSLPWVVGGISLALLAAGIASPHIGRTIERHGGRLVLSCGSLLFALGLGSLSLAASLPAYLASWIVIGVAMGAGLYDATFATLGRIYGRNARAAMTMLTVFGGFASTLCWPLTALLAGELGWRGTCLVYAGLHLGFCLPLNLFVLPGGNRTPALSAEGDVPAPHPQQGISGRRRTMMIALLTVIFTSGSALVTVISVHLISILQTRGMTLAAAVALGALMGPAQVGARLIELAFGRYYHPLWTLITSTTLTAVGLALMQTPYMVAAVALVVYGSGVGLSSVARGTVPLKLFGPLGYASLMGRLSLPCMLAQALSPSLASLLMAHGDTRMTLNIVLGMAAVNAVLAVVLRAAARKADS
jgi:predicted MFS family arabinose efflux permease